MSEDLVNTLEVELREKDILTDNVSARLVYVNDALVPSLSVTSSDAGFKCFSETDVENLEPHIKSVFGYLPDGVSDVFPYKDDTTRKKIPLSVLSGVDHMVGPFNGQGAVNIQQGTGAFAAVNGLKCKEVSVVDVGDDEQLDKPVHIIRCYDKAGVGGASHPRTILSTGDNSVVEVIQQAVEVGGDWGVEEVRACESRRTSHWYQLT